MNAARGGLYLRRNPYAAYDSLILLVVVAYQEPAFGHDHHICFVAFEHGRDAVGGLQIFRLLFFPDIHDDRYIFFVRACGLLLTKAYACDSFDLLERFAGSCASIAESLL